LETDKTSDRIAALALVLSIASSGFAVYQWLSTEQSEHVHAAIDVSSKYISDWENTDILRRQYESGTGGAGLKSKIMKQNAFVEYIAYSIK
jgi:hypothetical protein